jgi:hypothetical protein
MKRVASRRRLSIEREKYFGNPNSHKTGEAVGAEVGVSVKFLGVRVGAVVGEQVGLMVVG